MDRDRWYDIEIRGHLRKHARANAGHDQRRVKIYSTWIPVLIDLRKTNRREIPRGHAKLHQFLKPEKNNEAQLVVGPLFYYILSIHYLNTAREYVDGLRESGWSEVLFLEISLLIAFSEWLILTACRTAMVVISRARTSTVRVFPFFMIKIGFTSFL